MDAQRKKDILAAFERSKGHIRTEIGKNLKARHVPELVFKYDGSLDYGAKMDSILATSDSTVSFTMFSSLEGTMPHATDPPFS